MDTKKYDFSKYSNPLRSIANELIAPWQKSMEDSRVSMSVSVEFARVRYALESLANRIDKMEEKLNFKF